MQLNRHFALIATAAALTLTQAGCASAPDLSSLGIALGAGGSAAEKQQNPAANPYQYEVNASTDKVFNASLAAAANMGKVVSSDRTSGLIQWQVGNWTVTATVAKDGNNTSVALGMVFKTDTAMRDGRTCLAT